MMNQPMELIGSPAQFEELRQMVTTVDIPAGFCGWHPNELTQWLDDVQNDETVSDPDYYRARQAVFYALGIDPEDVGGAP